MQLRKSSDREWCDFGLYNISNDILIEPYNLKISQMKTADNASSKAGVYFAITGKKLVDGLQWDNYFNQLNNDRNLEHTSAADYTYVVIDKNNKNHKIIGMREISAFVPNGNNLPFQINWGKVKKVERPLQESKDFILAAFQESLLKRCMPFQAFNKYFNQNDNI